MNIRKMKKEDVDRIVTEGKLHLNCMVRVYRKQIAKGKYLIHEHPATAISWSEKEIVKLAAPSDVVVVTADQCQYGQTTPSQHGERLPALKPTKFMTKAMPMARLLQRRCPRKHVHQPLVSGRCAAAAFYPLKLVRALIKGIADT